MKSAGSEKHSVGNQSGATLVELMIAVVLGLIIMLAISGLVIASKSIHSTQIDASDMQDTARTVFNNIARSAKQAGFINYEENSTLFIPSDDTSPSIIGLDASTLKAASHGIDTPTKSLNNSSDVLAIRFLGAGNGNEIDAPLNCAGAGVPAPTSQESVDEDRGWSIYYVAKDDGGLPNLYCKYKKNSFTAQAIAEGVESFQVLYGIDTSTPSNGVANRFLNATEINALDANIPLTEINKKTHWKKVTAIKVAMLIRGTHNSNTNNTAITYNLFGEDYSNPSDKGTKILGTDIPKAQAKNLRSVYSTTIQLKNTMN